MKMLFEDRIVSWVDSFDVFDEIGRKLFRVEGQKGREKGQIKIYNCYLHNKSVATLRESEDAPSVEIKHGTRFVSTVRRVFTKLRSFFDLGFLDWHAEGDFDHGSFSIYDANDRAIASVGETLFRHEYVRVIDSLPEFLLHSLTFTLAIDVQVSPVQASSPSAPSAEPASAPAAMASAAMTSAGMASAAMTTSAAMATSAGLAAPVPSSARHDPVSC